MQVSIEISLYPLKNEFIPPIDDFIKKLEKYNDVEIMKNLESIQMERHGLNGNWEKMKKEMRL